MIHISTTILPKSRQFFKNKYIYINTDTLNHIRLYLFYSSFHLLVHVYYMNISKKKANLNILIQNQIACFSQLKFNIKLIGRLFFVVTF